MQTIFKKSNYWIALCLILFLAVLLRLYDFNRSLYIAEVQLSTFVGMNMGDNLLVDTAKYSTQVGKIDKEIFLRTTFRDKSAPFYRIFMFFWINLFGDSEIAIRIPSLISGVLSILLIYLISLKLFSRKVAILASVLLCLSPVHIWCSNTSWYYAMPIFFILLSIFSYYKLTSGSKINIAWFIIYSTSIFLAVFSHWYACVYLAAISISCVLGINKVKSVILTSNLLIFGCALLYLFLKFKFGGLAEEFPFVFGNKMSFLRPFDPFELWTLFFNWFLFGNSIWSFNPYLSSARIFLKNPVMIIIQLCFFLIFLRGILQVLRGPERRYGIDIIIYLFLLPLLLLGLPYFGIKNIYIERYVVFSLPFFFIILSNGLINFRNKIAESMCIIVAVLFSLTAFVFYFSKPEGWTVFKPTVEWKSVFRYFNGELKEAKEAVPVFWVRPGPISSGYSNGEVLYYEFKHQDILKDKKGLLICPQNYATIIGTISKTLSSENIKLFYLIEYKDPFNRGGDLNGKRLSSMLEGPKITLQEIKNFRSLELYKFKIN